MPYEPCQYYVAFDGIDTLARSKDEALAIAECLATYENPENDPVSVFVFTGEGRSTMIAQISMVDGKLDTWLKR